MDNPELKPSNLLLGSLDPADLALLSGYFKLFKLRAGAVLQEANSIVERVWFPSSGLISLAIAMDDGRSIETVAVGREGSIGVLPTFNGSSRCRATVQIAGTAACISATALQAAMWHSEGIRDVVWRYAGSLLAEVQQLAACNVLHPLEARLARCLLQADDKSSSNGRLDFTQEDLAQTLGVRRTTITLLARVFQQNGLIQYRRGHITIRDRVNLEHHACDCYRIMRRLDGSRPSAIGDASVG